MFQTDEITSIICCISSRCLFKMLWRVLFYVIFKACVSGKKNEFLKHFFAFFSKQEKMRYEVSILQRRYVL